MIIATTMQEPPAVAKSVTFREVAPPREHFADRVQKELHDDDAFAWLTVTSVLLGVVSIGVAGMAVTVLWIVAGH